MEGLSTLSRDKSIQNWYEASSPPDIARQAFDEAIEYFKTHLTDDECKRIWLGDKTSMNEIQQIVLDAKKKYDASSGTKKKVQKALDKFSAQFMYYGAVLDVLAQHHPEYVALAWGAVKFVFVGVLNHSELLLQLSKALATIGEILPRTDLNAALYPTDRMKEALSRLYAYIIKFFQQAVEWYKLSTTSRAVSSIFKPFELSFKDTCDKVNESSRMVDDIANAAVKAEIRDLHITVNNMHIKFNEMEIKFTELMQIAINIQATNNMVHLGVQAQKQKLNEIRFSRISEIRTIKPEPEDCEKIRHAVSSRHSRRANRPRAPAQLLQNLSRWVSIPDASFLLVQAHQHGRFRSIDDTSNCIGLLLSTPAKVIWSLLDRHSIERLPFTREFLKSLVVEILQPRNPQSANNPNHTGSTATLEVKKWPSYDWRQGEELFSKGMVSEPYFSQLYKAGDALVHVRNKSGDVRGLICESSRYEVSSNSVVLNCWALMFNGSFRKVLTALNVRWPSNETGSIRVIDLDCYPLKFDQSNLGCHLEARGRVFLDCRRRLFVSYLTPSSSNGVSQTSARYMIDYDMYRYAHPQNPIFADPPGDEFHLGVGETAGERPLESNLLITLPSVIAGFGMKDKTWVDLVVSQISPVIWNKDMLDDLVIKPRNKELLIALISQDYRDEASADIVRGKSDGLVILLQGGPGTGKTLTAESVAEYLEKPLYHVSLAEVGDDPHGAAKYLENVFYVGQTWGCILLLDDADVLLKEQRITDMRRNAVVSTFVRMLDEYQGILIHTTTHLNSFHEAFQSRIQLTLHFLSPSQDESRKIWYKLIHKLALIGESINEVELLDSLDVLAKFNLNGQQIKDAVRAAMRLARYKKAELDFRHFAAVIGVDGELEDYMKKKHGPDDEEYVRAQSLRKGQFQ